MTDDPGIPFERHGVVGTLFSPKVQLTRDELIFYGECCCAPGPDAMTREQTVALVTAIGDAKGYPQAMRDKVIAFIDELVLRGQAPEGNA